MKTVSQVLFQNLSLLYLWSDTSLYQVVVGCLFVERKQAGWESRAVWLGLHLLHTLTVGLLYIITHRGLRLQVFPCALELLYAPLGPFTLKVFLLKNIAYLYFKFCSL